MRTYWNIRDNIMIPSKIDIPYPLFFIGRLNTIRYNDLLKRYLRKYNSIDFFFTPQY